MKVKLLEPIEAFVALDLDPPPELAGKPHLAVWKLEQHAEAGLITAKLMRGCAVWRPDGRLLRYFATAGDVVVDGDLVMVLENRFGPCANGSGIGHAIELWRRPDARAEFPVTPLASFPVCVPMGGVTGLVVSPRGALAIACWRDQNRWGYVGVDLATRSQTELEASWPTTTMCPPQFTSDGRHLVSCQFERAAWWNDETDDPSEAPSPGGRRRVGIISAHDVDANTVRECEVLVDLPDGWIPEDPYDSAWYRIWGPVRVDGGELMAWLPDHTTINVRPPLAGSILLERPLGTTRPSAD